MHHAAGPLDAFDDRVVDRGDLAAVDERTLAPLAAHQRVMNVLDAAKAAGLTRVAFVAQQKDKP